MKNAPLAILALALGVAACTEIATSPQTQSGSDLAVKYRLSNPPPPPIDTGASFFVTGIATNLLQSLPSGLLGSVQVAPGQIGRKSLSVSGPLIVPVTYLLNPGGTSGYLHFHDAPDANSDANGMVKWSSGRFSGKGKVTFDTDAGPLVIDLSSVEQFPNSSFSGCGGFFESPPLTAAASRPDSFCFQVKFASATLNGNEVGPVFVTATCFARPENNFCGEE